MSEPVIVDAGPMVAIVSRCDSNRTWVLEQATHLPFTLLTCEAAVSEACFLLGKKRKPIMDMLRMGRIEIAFSLPENTDQIAASMEKYADVPMSLADACLVRMSEVHEKCKVFTLDSDFKIYKRHGRRAIPLIHPH